MTISPEVIAEQVMGYVVGASELIPTLQPSSKKTYSVAILPQGPHFYTGLLQAAGYLLLDEKKKNLLVISQQTDDPKSILVDGNEYGPILGQMWKTPTIRLETIVRSLGAKLSSQKQTMLLDQMRFQLPFVRTITDTEQLLHISVGEKIPQSQISKLLAWIKKNSKTHNIILLTNIDLPLSTKINKQNEQRKLAEMITNTDAKSPMLVKIFQSINKYTKQKPEMVAYVNPGDFGKNTSVMTRYICAVS